MDVTKFAALVLEQTQARLKADYPTSPQWEWERVAVRPGPVYTKVDIGPEGNMSGKYMIENATGTIFGIKGYGKVHKGHRYGTLETVRQWYWGGYTGRKIEPEVARRDLPTGSGEGWLVRYLGHSYAISQGHDGAVQAFAWNDQAGHITDWDDLAGGRGYTHEQVLAELVARPVDEDDGRVLSRMDVLERAEAAANRREPVDPELFRRTAPQWNCVDFPDGPHYTPGGYAGGCSWCGMTREQITAEYAAREAQPHAGPCSDCGCPA